MRGSVVSAKHRAWFPITIIIMTTGPTNNQSQPSEPRPARGLAPRTCSLLWNARLSAAMHTFDGPFIVVFLCSEQITPTSVILGDATCFCADVVRCCFFFFYDPLKAQHPNEDELSLGGITLLRIIFNKNILWSRQNAINWNVKKKKNK